MMQLESAKTDFIWFQKTTNLTNVWEKVFFSFFTLMDNM